MFVKFVFVKFKMCYVFWWFGMWLIDWWDGGDNIVELIGLFCICLIFFLFGDKFWFLIVIIGKFGRGCMRDVGIGILLFWILWLGEFFGVCGLVKDLEKNLLLWIL